MTGEPSSAPLNSILTGNRERKFASVEAACSKMHKDAVVFRNGVNCKAPRSVARADISQALLDSGSSFGGSLSTLFQPLGAEYNLAAKFPNSEVTVKNIAVYQRLMEELQGAFRLQSTTDAPETLAPELDLIDSRIVEPSKELVEICKRIRKTCTKRDHKLVDYDRHNNSLNKLRSKKEKSLSDEKNLFKVSVDPLLLSDIQVEQQFEVASGEYEHYNNLLKEELPRFLELASRFIDPLFHSFYYMQLNVYYIMLEKLQSFADGKYDLERRDIEDIYLEQRGDAAEQLDALNITQRPASTGEKNHIMYAKLTCKPRFSSKHGRTAESHAQLLTHLKPVSTERRPPRTPRAVWIARCRLALTPVGPQSRPPLPPTALRRVHLSPGRRRHRRRRLSSPSRERLRNSTAPPSSTMRLK